MPAPTITTGISSSPYIDGQSITVLGRYTSDIFWPVPDLCPVTVTITKPDTTTFTLALTYGPVVYGGTLYRQYSGTFTPDQGGTYTITHQSPYLDLEGPGGSGGMDWGHYIVPAATVSGPVTVQSFTIAVDPTSLTIAKGNATIINVDTTSIGGFSQSVTLSVSGLPAGATPGFSYPSITPTASTTLTISTTPLTTIGHSTLTISGTAGSLVKQTTVSLDVVTPLSSSATPENTRVHIGQSVTFTASGSNGKTPYGYQWYQGASPLSGETGASLTVSKSSVGSYTYHCHVTDTILSTHETNDVTLYVDDFALSSPQSIQMVTKGSAVSYLLNLSSSSGFSNSLTLSATGLPAGATATFNTSSVIPSASGTIVNLTIQTSPSTPVAISNFTITALDGAYSHTKQLTINCLAPMSNIIQSSSSVVTVNQNVNLTVNPSGGLVPYSYQWYEGQTALTEKTSSSLIVNKTVAGVYTYFCRVTDARQTVLGSENVTLTFTDFTLICSSAAISVTRGSSVSCNLSLTGVYGFGDPVVLVVSGLPSDVSSTLGESIISPNASTTLTLQTLSSASAGTYNVTVTGASASLMRTTVIQLTINAPSYAVIVSAGVGGSISPSGTLSATEGSSCIFTVTANNGFAIADILDNGVSKGAQATYTLSDIRAAHQINVTFIPTYTVTVTAGLGGSITPSGTLNATEGSSYIFTITANNGYQIADVTDNGVSKGALGTYTLSDIRATHLINATFTPTYAITVTAGLGGSISPSGSFVAASGSSYNFTITVESGYQLVDVTDNGVSKGAVSSYSINNVYEAHQINAVFASTKITLPTGSGTVEVTLNAGGNITSLQISNAALSSDQSAAKTILSFNVTGPSGSVGFSNMTILKSSIPYGTTPIVYIDGVQATNQGYTQDATNYYVWYSTNFSDHQIQIQFTGSSSSGGGGSSSGSSSSSSSSSTSSTNKPSPTTNPTPTPTQIPPTPQPTANATVSPANDTMVQPPSVSYTSLIISFFKDWNTVIGSGSLVGVITVSLSVYTIRRQKKVGDKTKNLRGQYIDKLKAYNSKKLDKAQRQAIERIMEEIMTDKELQKDEVERLTSYANHLLRKK